MLGLEVVLLDGGETLQFAQVDVEATSHREALLDGLAASRVREDEHAAAAAAARTEVLAAAVKGHAEALEAETQRVLDLAEQREAYLRERRREETELRERLGAVLQRQDAVRHRCEDATQRLQACRGTGHAQAAGDSGARNVPAVNGGELPSMELEAAPQLDLEVASHRKALLDALTCSQLKAVLRQNGLPVGGQKADLVARALGALVWAEPGRDRGAPQLARGSPAAPRGSRACGH